MDNETLILAGMLEAECGAQGVSASDMATVLSEIAEGPTLWQGPRLQNLDEYRQRTRRRIARWRASSAALPQLPDLSAFLAAAQGKDMRVEVANFDDWARLTSLSRPQGIVSAYVRRRATGEWHWRWPLRLGVLQSPLAARWISEAQGSGNYGALYQASENDGSSACELMFIPADRISETFDSAVVVVVMGVEPQNLMSAPRAGPMAQPAPRGGLSSPAEPDALKADILDAAMRLGRAGVVFCPGDSLAWVEHLIVELSHDAPLDLALAKAAPRAVPALDPEFAARTTIRQWGMELSLSLRAGSKESFAEQLDGLLSGRYASERGEASETVHLSQVVRKDGIQAEIRGGAPRSAAKPRHRPPLPKAATATPAPHQQPAPPDERRLQAVVHGATAPGAQRELTDRFIPGKEHDVAVRIAAQAAPGVVSAPTPFPHPAPGQDITLDVSIIAGGQRSKCKLLLPAAADSDWTPQARFWVPPEPASFAVFIEVAYQGRVIQSATLTGSPFELSVDVSEPAATLGDRPAAQGSLTILDGPHGSPTVLDLDTDAGSINEIQIDQATKDLRRELLAAFLAPPASLAQAAGVLTRLAVRGRILYDRLAGPAGEYHDSDEWIHVSAFSKADVPIELIYAHPMPSNDESVPVCPQALAGATSCSRNCTHRADAQVVCPYGFWATSKMIERRRHVHGRTNTVPAAQRSVAPTRSAVVGISLKADEADATSSARIIQALSQAVTSPVVAKSWKELEDKAAEHPKLLVLVTHTIEPQGGNVLATSLELNGDVRAIHRIGEAAVNPGRLQPGPVVLALGCDTNSLTAGFTDLVVNLHNAHAEIVLSALSPIPGKGVADFLQSFLPLLKASVAAPGQHRFGAVMLAARRATIAKGDLMALALSATGDADVELTP